MKMKPLLMMRTRGLQGPVMRNVPNLPAGMLAKSSGAFIGIGTLQGDVTHLGIPVTHLGAQVTHG